MKKSNFGIVLTIALLHSPMGFCDSDQSAPNGQGAGQKISLEQYLEQVKGNHDGVKSSNQAMSGAELTVREGELLTMPQLFGTAQYTNDYKPNPLFPYTNYLSTQFDFGVSETTDFGLQAKLHYTYNNFVYNGIQIFAAPLEYQMGPLLEVTQSLLRNGFGSEIQAQKEVIEANSKAQKFTQSYQIKSLLFEAESNYWKLSLAREARKVSQDAFDRAKRIYDYSAKKANQGLADQSESLQATAALESRRVDLQVAQEDEENAGRAYNSSRGVDSDVVADELDPLTDLATEKLTRAQAMQTRDDVRAAQESTRASIANSKVSAEKDRTTLEIFGQIGLTGQNPDEPSAINQAFSFAKPTQVIGLRLNIPLAFGIVDDSLTGWRQQELASKYNLQRRIFEQERDWHDLNKKFENAVARFDLYQKLETAQRAKLDNEKMRHKHGRTTLVNVINFEVDYLLAQLGKIRTLAEILQLHAQLKLFGDKYESR